MKPSSGLIFSHVHGRGEMEGVESVGTRLGSVLPSAGHSLVFAWLCLYGYSAKVLAWKQQVVYAQEICLPSYKHANVHSSVNSCITL